MKTLKYLSFFSLFLFVCGAMIGIQKTEENKRSLLASKAQLDHINAKIELAVPRDLIDAQRNAQNAFDRHNNNSEPKAVLYISILFLAMFALLYSFYKAAENSISRKGN